MASSRIIRESFISSPTVLAIRPYDRQDRIPRYWLMCDNWGCFLADPAYVKGQLWALRDDMTTAAVKDDLDAYEAAGLIERWEEQGRTYGFWRTWARHQRSRDEQKYPPKYPVPPSVRQFASFSEYYAAGADKLLHSLEASGVAASSREEPLVAPSRARDSGSDSDSAFVFVKGGVGGYSLADSSDEGAPPKVAKKPAGKSDTIGRVVQVYADAFEERYGRPPIITGASRGQLGHCLRAWPDGVDSFCDLLRIFVADNDPWLCDKGHGLQFLSGRLNRYRAGADIAAPESRLTQHNRRVVQNYLKRQEAIDVE